jgi:hypothetical protein
MLAFALFLPPHLLTHLILLRLHLLLIRPHHPHQTPPRLRLHRLLRLPRHPSLILRLHLSLPIRC